FHAGLECSLDDDLIAGLHSHRLAGENPHHQRGPPSIATTVTSPTSPPVGASLIKASGLQGSAPVQIEPTGVPAGMTTSAVSFDVVPHGPAQVMTSLTGDHAPGRHGSASEGGALSNWNLVSAPRAALTWNVKL